MADSKTVKAVIKEGGKKGQDLQGVSETGGVSYFNINVDNTNLVKGDLVLLEKFLEGANIEVEEGSEERKGGAGGLAKFLLSAGDDQLAIIGQVPKSLPEEKRKLSLEDWWNDLKTVMGGEPTIVEQNEEIIKAVLKADQEKGVFPLKVRDAVIDQSFRLLRQKGLLPDNDSDSDDVNYAEAAGVEW